MTLTNAARFKISGTASADGLGNKIYRAKANEVLSFTLEDSPSLANSVTYQLFDPADPKSPQASYTAIQKTNAGHGLKFGGGGYSESPANVNGAVTAQMYDGVIVLIDGPASWVVRCTVTLADGTTNVYERGVALIAFPDGYREPVFAERDQFFAQGWGTSPLGAQISNSFPQRSIFRQGSQNSIQTATYTITPTANRVMIAMAQVHGQKDAGATQGLWGLRRVYATSPSGVLSISTNAGGETLDGTILETEFQPSFSTSGNDIALAVNTKINGHTFTYSVWFTVMEAKT